MVDGDAAPRREWAPSIGFGLVVGLVAAAAVVTLVALPLFALAAYAEPGSGLNRPFVHTGLVRVALPAGAIIGVVVAIVMARWRRDGGTMPRSEA